MKTQFTKGPWVARGGIPSRIYGMQRTDKEVIVAAVGNILENSGANANLIAAAPEMYEKLEWLADYFGQEDSKFGVDTSVEIESLLAKARGEQ